MRVLLLNNPNSGRGTGAAIADRLAERLQDAGHGVWRLAAGPNLQTSTLQEAVTESELLVIAGGDGTLHHALPTVIRTGVSLYHFPLGTENLFAREFGMDSRPETLLRAIDRWRVKLCDAGVCNERPFSLMVGVGFDAGVVERLAAHRTGGTSRAEYLRHALDELINPRVPRFTIHVNGRRIIDARQGMVLVANSRQYAARLDPARLANMSDGLLDVVFYPHGNSAELGAWLLSTAAGSHLEVDGLVTAQGADIQIQVDYAAPHQIDGEAAGLAPQRTDSEGFGFDLRVLPASLSVLLP